ncbi:MAG: hypothetical protein ACK56N_15770 [Betaproteobacteria bacterium]
MSKRASRKRSIASVDPAAADPLTLDEARALVRRAAATEARRAPGRAALPARQARPSDAERSTKQAQVTPATVAAQRERLLRASRVERARRQREYTAVMKLLKERGTRAPGRRRGRPFAPLQVLAEGDSWFEYPVPLFGGGIVPRLEARLGVPILNLAAAGDEVRDMLGVAQRQRLIDCLRAGCPAGGPWDALLFSGGGNDIVADPMALWVRDYDPRVPPATLLHQPRFDAALALVRAGYEDLIALRDALSPGTHLVFHAYDYALPDGRGICHYGPWLKPAFDLRGFPTLQAAWPVVIAMLQQFAAMLAALATYPRISVINGQGTLKPVPAAWHNELHPASAGYDRFAALFQRQLRSLFPDRVA